LQGSEETRSISRRHIINSESSINQINNPNSPELRQILIPFHLPGQEEQETFFSFQSRNHHQLNKFTQDQYDVIHRSIVPLNRENFMLTMPQSNRISIPLPIMHSGIFSHLIINLQRMMP
jgi:hypothetical protein